MAGRALGIGGHCCIESQPGQGTRMVVALPHGSSYDFTSVFFSSEYKAPTPFKSLLNSDLV
jgi:hypothetical protein